MTSARTAGMYRRSAGMAAATPTASTISLDSPMRHHLVDKTVFLTGQVNFSERMVIILVSTAKFQTVFSGNSKNTAANTAAASTTANRISPNVSTW